MKVLLRKIVSEQNGIVEYADRVMDGEVLLIGSSPQCDLQLLGHGISAVHGKLEKTGNTVQLKATRGQRIRCDGAAVEQLALTAGKNWELGGHRFSCSKTPSGFDLALEWRAAEVPGHMLEGAYRTSLEQLRFSIHKTSWVLALVVLLLAGVAPVMNYFLTADRAVPEMLAGLETSLESLWISGPLLDAHKVAIGNNCSVCHQQAFVRVDNQACTQCHGELSEHLPPGHQKMTAFTSFDCQNCHKEHNEPQSIVSRSDSLCRNCHDDLDPSVEGFSIARHPEFALDMLKPVIEDFGGVTSVSWAPEKRLRSDEPVESSHLKFPHDVHLDSEAVSHPLRGDGMQCMDCHALSSDREHFLPITMENHCASCHDLSFDPVNPQRQLPHGSPELVLGALEAHFVKLAFNPLDLATLERRRVPGKSWEFSRCDMDYQCAKQQAVREAERQFLQRGCVTCHEVNRQAVAADGNFWEVLPVKLNSDWYREARFDHQSHLTQANLSGDQVCLTCHVATASSASSDVLMPGISQCVDCHGEQNRHGQVPLNCISCHDYHQENPQHNNRLSVPIMALIQGEKDG